MPEGPELRVSRDFLRNILQDRYLVSAFPGKSGRYRNSDPSGHDLLSSQLQQGNSPKINFIGTRGKFMYWELKFSKESLYLTCTYGMTGQWQEGVAHQTYGITYTSEINSYAPLQALNFCDARHFGTIKVVGEAELNKKLLSLGWDVLESGVPATLWAKEFLKKNKKCIGSVLMDQSFLAGVGNYIRAESLYLAEISPWTLAKDLTFEQLHVLLEKIHYVMTLSYQLQGASILTYRTVDGQKGGMEFVCYGRTSDTKGNPIIREETPEGRTIHWCPNIQR